eukprot:7791604-Pyramimonas_sp.AAC.1
MVSQRQFSNKRALAPVRILEKSRVLHMPMESCQTGIWSRMPTSFARPCERAGGGTTRVL